MIRLRPFRTLSSRLLAVPAGVPVQAIVAVETQLPADVQSVRIDGPSGDPELARNLLAALVLPYTSIDRRLLEGQRVEGHVGGRL